MRPMGIAWRVAGIGLALGLVLGAAACSSTAEQPASDQPASRELLSAPEAPDGESIFNLDLSLVDHNGASLHLGDLKGRPMLAAMVYTSCKDVCILVTEQMKAIERQLAGVDRDVQYTLFSLDPGRDTPAAMREFARVQKLDTTRWRIVATDEEGVRDLAAVFGVRYQPEADGEIAHSAVIVVIDAAGVVRHRQVGLTNDARALVQAVKQVRR